MLLYIGNTTRQIVDFAYRVERGGATTRILGPASGANCATVLSSKLVPRTRASAFGLPNLRDMPAASTTICSLGLAAAFIGIMLT